MKNTESILRAEINIPMAYLKCQITSWGRMFCDIENKDSYSSNYAVINKNENIDKAIEEIESFYDSIGIKSKIFNRMDSLKLDFLRPYFEKHDYKLREFELEWMLLDLREKEYNSGLNNIRNCEIKKVNKVLEGKEYELAVEQDDGDTYGVNQLNKQIAAGGIMFFAKDESGRAASMALAEKYDDIVYITNVYTTPSMRRKGYGLSVMNAVLKYFKDAIFYLHSGNPEAIRIYRKLGFSGENIKSWWAVKGELPEWCR